MLQPTRFSLPVLFGLLLALACGENGPARTPLVVVAPLLDSLFVGDVLTARTATYFDAQGNVQPTGPVRWNSSDTTVFRVDSVTGEIVGRGPGSAVLGARANNVRGTALLVVSRVLDLSLLLDTLYLMPGDTITVPALVRHKTGPPPPLRFRAAVQGIFALDSVTGLVTALGAGGPIPFTVHADTVSAAGAVEVVQLSDTIGGKSYYTMLGTVIRRGRAGARAVNYRREGDVSTFRVSLPVLSGNITVENMLLTLRDSVNAPGVFAIDSISPNELLGSGADPVCRPPRPWGLWSLQTNPPLRALSRMGGTLSITQVTSIAHGRAVSGRFTLTAQRADLYDDPLAALPIRGTFVAPLIADPSASCR